jgi:hypothetical protein
MAENIRCLIIQDSIVETILFGELETIREIFPDKLVLPLPDGMRCGPGDTWDGQVCISPPPTDPDWLTFRMSMLADPGYQRVISLVDQIPSVNALLITPLVAAISQNPPYLGIVEQLWNHLISLPPSEHLPTESEIQSWNQIAQTNCIPLAFLENGAITAA